MQIYDFGEWIKLEYWDEKIEYVKSLPKDKHNLCGIEYILNGNIHRINGPAIIRYNKDHNIWIEEYCLNDEPHRIDGPSYIRYYQSGSIAYEEYYLNGKYLSEEDWEKAIATL